MERCRCQTIHRILLFSFTGAAPASAGAPRTKRPEALTWLRFAARKGGVFAAAYAFR